MPLPKAVTRVLTGALSDALGDALRDALSDALALLFPVNCAGCDAPGIALCPACVATLAPRVITRQVGGLTVCSGTEFAGVPARVLRALKENGRTGLCRALAPALAAALAATGGVGAFGTASAGPLSAGVVVVPVPTSAAAMRRRGYRVTELLARRAGAQPVRALRQVRAVADQRGLSVGERAGNVTGSMRAARAVAGCRVVIVDDIVTTGATLAEASRALRHAGATVIGAATVAATPRWKPYGSADSQGSRQRVGRTAVDEA